MKKLVFAAVFAVLGAGGCTLLWVFNNDPEGLPCDFSQDPKGACLDGYVCVTVEDNDPDTNDQHQVCLKAGLKKKGDACAKTEECGRDLVCATGYVSCVDTPDDVNCELVSDADKKLACRPKCDKNNPTATCNDDELCFDDGKEQFCQQGVCATDSDCNTGTLAGFCVGEAVLGGKTGFCFEACDPLACSAGSCPDCRGVDGAVDQGSNCIPLLDESTLSTREMCDTAGTVAPFAACDLAGEPCQFGSFCNPFAGGGQVACTPWCDAAGGNPACDAPHQCQQIVQGSTLGFCSL